MELNGRTCRRSLAVLWHKRRNALLPPVLRFPVLTQRVRDLGQPRPAFGQFPDLRCGEILDAIRLRIAQRLKQPALRPGRARHAPGSSAPRQPAPPSDAQAPAPAASESDVDRLSRYPPESRESTMLGCRDLFSAVLG